MGTRDSDVPRAKELWIGMVEVRPRRGEATILGNAQGAFVNVITWATDSASFLVNAERVMEHLGGLFVSELVNAEPVRMRRAQSRDLESDVEDMIERAENNPNAIIYGTFHQFLNEDA